jgi:hypothetical protein
MTVTKNIFLVWALFSGSVARATRNRSTLLLLAGALVFLTGSASAQTPGMSQQMHKEQKQLTPEEQKKQEELDRNYKAASKIIPDQGPADPWADVRSTPTVKGQLKNQSLTPYHRDSFNKQTPQ